MKVTLNNVRISFPDIFTAKQFIGEGEPRFSAAFLFSPESDAASAINAAFDKVSVEKWADKAASTLKQLTAGNKICLQDGNAKDYEGYAGNMYLAASNKARPLVIDRDKSALAEADGKVYAGCYVNAIVDIWAQDNKFGKRINATLLGIQFVKDGDAFTANSKASEDDFSSLEITDDSEDLI